MDSQKNYGDSIILSGHIKYKISIFLLVKKRMPADNDGLKKDTNLKSVLQILGETYFSPEFFPCVKAFQQRNIRFFALCNVD